MDTLRSPSKPVYNYQKTVLMVVCILILGTGMRLYRLGHQSLWTDEVLTFLSSKGTLSNVLFQTDINTNILPLYYVVVNAVLKVGNQDALLRVPSVVFASFSILLLYFVAANWLGKTTGLICALLIAISPFHIWYSQEARPYSLLLFLGVLSIWFLQKLIHTPFGLKFKVGFIFTAAATFYCHTIAIAFIGAMGAYVLIAVTRRKWKSWIPVFGSIVLLVLPGIYKLIITPLNPAPEKPFSLFAVPYTIWSFTGGFSLGPSLTEMHLPDRISYVISQLHVIIPVLSIFSTLFGFGVFKLWKQEKTVCLISTFFFIFPLAFAVIGSIVTDNPFNVRYAILSFLPFVVFLAMGINSLQNPWLFRGALGIVVLVSLISSYNYFFNDRYHKENYRAAIHFLETHAVSSDLIICSAPYTIRNLKYYFNGQGNLQLIGYPNDTRYIKKPQIKSDLETIIGNRKRFWLFLCRTFHSDPEGYIRKYFDAHFRSDFEMKSNGIELIRYQRL